VTVEAILLVFVHAGTCGAQVGDLRRRDETLILGTLSRDRLWPARADATFPEVISTDRNAAYRTRRSEETVVDPRTVAGHEDVDSWKLAWRCPKCGGPLTLRPLDPDLIDQLDIAIANDRKRTIPI